MKSHVIFLTDAAREFAQKNQHSFMIKPQKYRYIFKTNLKTLLKLGTEDYVLYLIQDTENVIMIKLKKSSF